MATGGLPFLPGMMNSAGCLLVAPPTGIMDRARCVPGCHLHGRRPGRPDALLRPASRDELDEAGERATLAGADRLVLAGGPPGPDHPGDRRRRRRRARGRVGPDGRGSSRAPCITVVRTIFWVTSTLPSTGRIRATRLTTRGRAGRGSGRGWRRAAIAETMWLPLFQALVASWGSSTTAPIIRLSSTGTTIRTHTVTSRRARPVSAEGSWRCPGRSRRMRRDHVREQVGYPGGVGEDVVAVGPDDRRELLDHLEHLERDQQQQRVDPAEQPGRHRDHRDGGVEVEPGEIDAEPVPLGQAVGVGHVGVEGGPDEVEPHSHAARGGSAVASRGGVSELVEAGRDDREREHDQEQTRLAEGLGGGGRRRPCG